MPSFRSNRIDEVSRVWFVRAIFNGEPVSKWALKYGVTLSCATRWFRYEITKYCPVLRGRISKLTDRKTLLSEGPEMLLEYEKNKALEMGGNYPKPLRHTSTQFLAAKNF